MSGMMNPKAAYEDEGTNLFTQHSIYQDADFGVS